MATDDRPRQNAAPCQEDLGAVVRTKGFYWEDIADGFIHRPTSLLKPAYGERLTRPLTSPANSAPAKPKSPLDSQRAWGHSTACHLNS